MLQAAIARTNPNPAGAQNALPLFRLILSEGFRVPTFAQDFYRHALRPVNEAIQFVFARAMAEGKMRKADPDFAARELFAPYFHTTVIVSLLGRQAFDEWRGREYLAYGLESFCRNYDIRD